MKKQIEGQINLFEYISAEDQKISDDKTEDCFHFKKQENEKINTISFFPECSDCWCSTCKHNEKGKAVPRDFAGVKKPCPSCAFCIDQKKPEICEVNSYKNGCKLRAEEEGLFEFTT